MRKEGVTIRDLLNTLPQAGEVSWISIRPERRSQLQEKESVLADKAHGLVGDHYGGGANGKRQVTLINEEHLNAVASFLDEDKLDPALLRRNIMVKGINLLALKGQRFQIGEAILEMTGLCQPCSRMEENLGEGGYNAIRGHGGITARIIQSGTIKVGDTVKLIRP
ncbi:MOSC domain-containing protein YiiM [Catalinimonas alkaloidigena]|uniref:MOSC domain-containing protein n=1 Tax=Catalinimonas alkaloidigena TaxID=1075417 RepID=UPI002406794C|nr:MOSC domain-containing protein [Catalinimonas alkaloidigena]MDF9795981.1 MOSC domain-containing protein YiiM [Catalinimonas alkaloidigena]